MQDPYSGGGNSWGRSKGEGKEELGEEEWVSLNQLPKTQEMRRDGVFVCLGIKEMEGLYSSDGKSMNERSFNED